jgi:hypothetical protein
VRPSHCLVAILPVLLACQEKVRYPGPPDAKILVRGPETSPVLPVAADAGPRPIAVIVTPDGSILVTSRGSTAAAPGSVAVPRDLGGRRVPGVVRVLTDGGVAVLRAKVDESPKGSNGLKDATFATLVLKSGTSETPFSTGRRPDLKAVVAADPAMASRFYHEENLTLLGTHDRWATWISTVDGFLGGAHPYAERSLVTVDLEAGRLADLSSRYGSRKLAEVAGRQKDECVRHLAGVGPVEGAGGGAAWMLGLSHEFEYCAGGFRAIRIDPPSGEPAPAPTALTFLEGILSHPSSGLRMTGVLDYRATPSGDAAVALMALGKDDRLPAPGGKPDGRSRELRVWVRGMGSPAVVERVPAILSVQFLLEHPAPEKVLRFLVEL